MGPATQVISSIQRLLLQAPNSGPQSELLRDAGCRLGAQLQKLSSNERSHLPSFNNIFDIVRIYQDSDGVCHPAISSVVVCVSQLLQLISYHEKHPRKWGADSPSVVVGLCTGSIAAAVYASSTSLDDIRILAVHAVSIAFQLGIEVASASNLLYEQGNQLESWSLVIGQVSEQEAVQMLDSEHGIAQHESQQCFVSAVGLSSVTSSCVASFNKNDAVTYLCRVSLVRYPQINGFSKFLSRCSIDEDLLATFRSVRTLLSPSTGEPVKAANGLQLFEAVVLETLKSPLRLDRIVDSLTTQIEKLDSTVSVYLAEPSSALESLVAATRFRSNSTILSQSLMAMEGDECTRAPTIPFTQAPLAIVGISGRFPGADCVEDLWKVLEAGMDLHRMIPKDRFNVDTHVDATGKQKNTTSTPYGCFIERPGDFDPRFFNMSPKEAMQTDPMQRLGLVTAYEALEMSGFVANRTRSTALDRVGTFYGQTIDDYQNVNAAQDIGTYSVTGGIRCFGPGRINYFFKFGGPSYSIDTACSSGLATVQIACTSIWSGECDTAVTGGLNVITSPDLYAGLSRGQFLSKTGSCKSFDDGADGYCRADGVGSIVIKRLSDAIADRDTVLGVIRATATNHSANAPSITQPHAAAQSSLYRSILQQAGVEPLDVDYIEMHATGTQIGDRVEMASILDVFAPGNARHSRLPLHIGSLKPNIGHGGASAGTSALIKALLILNKQSIPPHIGIKGEINRGFPDLASKNVIIPRKTTPIPRKKNGKKRTILVSNFGAAGGNTALLLEETPSLRIQDISDRPVYPISVSGHTRSALVNNIRSLIIYLEANPGGISIADLSYTLSSRRKHYAFRATVVERSIFATIDALKRRCELDTVMISARSIVFAFTGQGAEYPAIAKELYMTSAKFRGDMDNFDNIAIQHGMPSILPLIVERPEGAAELSPVQMQVGLVCVQMALTRLLGSWNITPAAVIGHSLGEYGALQASGVLSASDTIYLVGSRAQLLEKNFEMHTHAMLAVGASQDVLRGLVSNFDGPVEIACVNSTQETVIAGPKSAIDELVAYLELSKFKCTRLRMPYAFHSAQVDPILEDFGHLAAHVTMQAPRVPLISSLKGKVLGTSDLIDANYLRDHCRLPVQFADALQHAAVDGQVVDTSAVFVEIGSHPLCSGMIRRTLKDRITFPTLRRKENAWVVLASTLASLHDMGVDVDWVEYQRELEPGCRLLSLPAYAFDNKNYWIDYNNDWTLRRGETISSVTETKLETISRISASVHRVVSEQYEGPNATAIFETDLGASEIHAAICGHRVNNSALCPASVYADMALTIAHHIKQQPQSGFSLSGHNISDTVWGIVQPYTLYGSASIRRMALAGVMGRTV